MDQIYNSMMVMLQRSAMQQESAPAKTSEQQEGPSFKDLLAAQKEAPADSVCTEETAEVSREEETLDVEQQLLAAALSAMQVPVIPAQQTELTEAQSGSVMPLMDQAAVQVVESAQLFTEGTEQQMQSVMEEAQVTESLQPIQNGQAAEENTADSGLSEQKGMDEAVRILDDTENTTDSDMMLEEAGSETPMFHDVKDVLVKVGETAGTESGEAIETPLKDQVGQQISKALDRGETRLSVRLNPQSLGQVDVQLTLTKDGSLQVELRAENQQTQQLLEKELTGLQHLLMRSTQQEVQIQVARHQESQQQNFEDGRQGGHQQNPQQERREERRSAEDFLQQLRLGLIPLEAEAS